MKELSEKTKITLSFAFILAGGLIWLTNIYGATMQNSRAIERIESKQDEYNRSIINIEKSIIEIHWDLKHLKQKRKGE